MNKQLAQDPNTKSEVLRSLAQQNDAEVLQLLTENPNTPLDVLYQLAELFPEHFWRNSLLSLLLLEDPNFIQKIPPSTIEALIESRDAPGWFLSTMIDRPALTVRSLAARHPNVPISLLEELSASPQEKHRRIAAFHPRLPLHCALRLLEDPEASVVLALVQSFSFEGEALETIFQKNDPLLFRALSENPSTTPQNLLRIFQQKDAACLPFLATHPNTDTSLLSELAHFSEVHSSIASHPNTSVETLLTLSKSAVSSVRRSVLCHPRLPISFGDQMARAEPGLLYATARVSTSLLESFLSSANEALRYAAAFHPGCPPHWLTRLANDESLRVHCAVAGNTSTPTSTLELLSSAGSIRILAALAGNPKTPSLLLWSLTKNGDEEIRLRVASNPSLAGWGIGELAQDPEAGIRLALSKNASLTLNELLPMRRDLDGSVRRSVKAAIRKRVSG